MDRLDRVLVDRGLCESRNRAQREILAGRVVVNGAVCTKPSFTIKSEDTVTLTQTVCPYVGIAALKLLHLMDDAAISCTGLRCLDVGASTGGFTQVLLERGAVHVTAVDVGSNQLHQSLREDSRITLCENTDIRDFARTVAVPFDLVTVDVSFISLEKIIPVIAPLGRVFVMLVKPQFETPPSSKNKRGVVSDPEIHRAVLQSVTSCLENNGLFVRFLTASRIVGGSGNREYFIVAGQSNTGYNVSTIITHEVYRDESFFVHKPE